MNDRQKSENENALPISQPALLERTCTRIHNVMCAISCSRINSDVSLMNHAANGVKQVCNRRLQSRQRTINSSSHIVRRACLNFCVEKNQRFFPRRLFVFSFVTEPTDKGESSWSTANDTCDNFEDVNERKVEIKTKSERKKRAI